MIVLKIALRSIMRRKKRMISIGALVVFGTILIVFGQTFTLSARYYSRASIINNFTGDFILYSDRSREKPSPFTFTTPLPNIQNIEKVTAFLESRRDVAVYVPLAQNYCVLSIDRDEKKTELPFIFYAVEPSRYRAVFPNIKILEGSYFDLEKGGSGSSGILVSQAQNSRYDKYYGMSLKVGDRITLFGLTEGGSVNAIKTSVAGIFEPIYYANVFDYVNFIDFKSYSNLYNFTGVAAGSLPGDLKEALASTNESDIFALGDKKLESINVETLKSEALSGYTMIAVKLEPAANPPEFLESIAQTGLPIKASAWNEASGGLAQVSSALQGFIYFAVALIFLIVTLILMNTLIINILERTSEIGTIRAIGGERGFVRALFLAETVLLNFAAGVLGVLISILLILAFQRSGVPLPKAVSNYLIGGGNLPLAVSAGPFLQAFIVVLAVSVIATIYPIRVATKITPLKAMSER